MRIMQMRMTDVKIRPANDWHIVRNLLGRCVHGEKA